MPLYETSPGPDLHACYLAYVMGYDDGWAAPTVVSRSNRFSDIERACYKAGWLDGIEDRREYETDWESWGEDDEGPEPDYGDYHRRSYDPPGMP